MTALSRRRRPLVSLTLALALALAVPGTFSPASAETEPRGVWPLHPRPEVVRGFDPPDVRWTAGHRGVDLRGTAGQSVRAAVPGRVSFVGRIAGVGVVVVDHGSTRTTYQPVAASVQVGEVLAAGAVLGRLQWFGTHCLPAACLHWGLLRGATYLDPLTLVGGPQPIRLLPVGAPSVASRTGLGVTPVSIPLPSLWQ